MIWIWFYTVPLQMQFSGLRDTDLTYEDKMINLNNLRKKYGLPVPQHTAQNGAEGKSD